jgi:hypothetical protein
LIGRWLLANLAIADVPRAQEGVKAALADLGAHVFAELAVGGGPDGVVLEREPDAGDRRHGHEGGKRHRRKRLQFHRAGARLAEDVDVAAELVVREYLDIQAAVRGFQDAGRGFLGADVEGVVGRDVVGELVAEFRGAEGKAGQYERHARGGAEQRIFLREMSMILFRQKKRPAGRFLRSRGERTLAGDGAAWATSWQSIDPAGATPNGFE